MFDVDDTLLAFEGEAVHIFLGEGRGLFVGIDGESEGEGRKEVCFDCKSGEQYFEMVLGFHL